MKLHNLKYFDPPQGLPGEGLKWVFLWLWTLTRCIVLYHLSGRIIATSHDLGPQKVAEEGNPLISGKSRLVKYDNLAKSM